ncbi:MAG TPA: hypothetical protein VG871_04805 [Vicinamibacterales bacterium]|nr:hypothetical protein [Vicinamibacterales bacterium]
MTLFIPAAVAAAAIVLSPVLAQRATTGQPPRYDAATEATVHGMVSDVQHVPSTGRGGGGLHLLVTTDGDTLDVHVGPESFASSKGFTFAKGDHVMVVGSKVTQDGKPALIAREITKDGKVLTLRDARGFPLWSGRRR